MVKFQLVFHDPKWLRKLNPKNPDLSRKFVGLMVETSHPQNKIIAEIPDS